MYLLIHPSEKALQQGEQIVKRLEQRIREKLDSNGIDAVIAVEGTVLLLELVESDVPDAVLALHLLPGIVFIAPCIQSDPDAEAILDRLADEDVEPREFRLTVTDTRDESISEQELIDALDEADWTHTPDHDTCLSIQVVGDDAYLHLETVNGIGGIPIDDSKIAVLPVRDRMDVYAGFLAMKHGFQVIPVVNDKQIDTVEEGIDLLEQLYTSIKPVTMQAETWEDAVGQAIELFRPEKIVTGTVKGDEPLLDDRKFDLHVWRPLVDREEEEVLEQYQDLLPVTL